MIRALLSILILFLVFGLFSQVNQIDSIGRKQGLWTRNWEHSKKTEYEGRFVDDIPIGQFRYYYPDGQVRSIIEHVNSRAAFVTFYFENEEVMSEGFYKDRLRDSLWLNYDRSGLTLSAERFKKNKLNGKRVVFYLRNQLERGELRILNETNFVDSLKQGDFACYFSSGALQERGQYLNDLKNGKWQLYDSNGGIESERTYKNGKLHGWVKVFDNSGSLLDRTLFQNGVKLTPKQTKNFLEHSNRNGIDLNH
jgi:antitoxin component YwqK of YwqJK toxin-antitoxin module